MMLVIARNEREGMLLIWQGLQLLPHSPPENATPQAGIRFPRQAGRLPATAMPLPRSRGSQARRLLALCD